MKKLAAFFCLLTLAACGDSKPASVLESSFGAFPTAKYDCMQWQDRERCYYTVPPKDAPTKLIVALHPAFTTVKLTEDVSHLAEQAVPKGYLVAYPEGIDKQWNDGRVMTEVKTYNFKTDDVGFLEAVTRKLQAQYGITPNHTTIAGMSNGGMMTLRMVCQSDVFGSAATVVANLPKGLRDQCSAKPKAMVMMFGTKDEVVDFPGGILADSGVATEWGEIESAEATIDFFAARNECGNDYHGTVMKDAAIDDTVANAREYGCKAGNFRVFITEGQGHTWPGESSRLLAWISMRGPVTKQFNAGDEILQFLSTAAR